MDMRQDHVAYEANRAKLTQLIADATEKAQKIERDVSIEDADYWKGVRDGLRRALNVIEGKG